MGLFNPQASFASVCNTEESGNLLLQTALTLLWLNLIACAVSPLKAAFGIAARKDVQVAQLLAPRYYPPWDLAHTGWVL